MKKIILLILLATGTVAHCMYLMHKKNENIEKVKNCSRMEDFYVKASKDEEKYVHKLIADICCKAKDHGTLKALCGCSINNKNKLIELGEKLDDAGNISKLKIIAVWRNELNKNKRAWIAECDTSIRGKRIYLCFIPDKKGNTLLLDDIN
ncbi:MAG: hypothetical protein JXR78_18145 [Victivallales bacterium]|nr:hypothetical protein [Victivallales bacterium]